MEISTVLLPVVTDKFDATVAFYKKITGKEVSVEAAHDGYKLNLIGHFVILTAMGDPEAVRIPSMVNAIFLVDDLQAYWEVMEKESRNVIVPVTQVSTGIRFIVEQQDGKIIEYLQLNEG